MQPGRPAVVGLLHTTRSVTFNHAENTVGFRIRYVTRCWRTAVTAPSCWVPMTLALIVTPSPNDTRANVDAECGQPWLHGFDEKPCFTTTDLTRVTIVFPTGYPVFAYAPSARSSQCTGGTHTYSVVQIIVAICKFVYTKQKTLDFATSQESSFIVPQSEHVHHSFSCQSH